MPEGFVKAETVNDALIAFNKGFWSTALGYATWPVMVEDYQGHLYRPVSYSEDEDEDEDSMPATPTQESWCGLQPLPPVLDAPQSCGCCWLVGRVCMALPVRADTRAHACAGAASPRYVWFVAHGAVQVADGHDPLPVAP